MRFLLLAALTAASLADVCTDFCDNTPGICSSRSSYCQSSKACYDLYFTDNTKSKICSSASSGCPKSQPVLCREIPAILELIHKSRSDSPSSGPHRGLETDDRNADPKGKARPAVSAEKTGSAKESREGQESRRAIEESLFPHEEHAREEKELDEAPKASLIEVKNEKQLQPAEEEMKRAIGQSLALQKQNKARESSEPREREEILKLSRIEAQQEKAKKEQPEPVSQAKKEKPKTVPQAKRSAKLSIIQRREEEQMNKAIEESLALEKKREEEENSEAKELEEVLKLSLIEAQQEEAKKEQPEPVSQAKKEKPKTVPQANGSTKLTRRQKLEEKRMNKAIEESLALQKQREEEENSEARQLEEVLKLSLIEPQQEEAKKEQPEPVSQPIESSHSLNMITKKAELSKAEKRFQEALQAFLNGGENKETPSPSEKGKKEPRATEEAKKENRPPIPIRSKWVGRFMPSKPKPSTDMCGKLCEGFVQCGTNGSYCKGREHDCHDLFWKNSREICSRTSGEDCPRNSPVVSCADAGRFHRAKTSRPLMAAQAGDSNKSPLFSFGRRGVRNLGNTCYLGATLQLLTHLPVLRDLILAADPARAPKADRLATLPLNEALAVMKSAFKQQWDVHSLEADTSVPMDSSAVLDVLARQRGYGFEVGIQEDAHEALRTILGLVEECLRRPDNTSPITDLFSIRIRKERVCSACDHHRVTYDTVQDLFLPVPDVPNQQPVSLEECFRAYFRPEVIEEVSCAGGVCDTLARANAAQTSSIAGSPPVLLITLKRFEFVMGPVPRRRRIDTNVVIPTEIDLAQLPGNGEGRYRLIGAIHHIGPRLDSGHYVADMMHPEDGHFYHADDSTVTPRRVEGLKGPTPYVLMYQRID